MLETRKVRDEKGSPVIVTTDLHFIDLRASGKENYGKEETAVRFHGNTVTVRNDILSKYGLKLRVTNTEEDYNSEPDPKAGVFPVVIHCRDTVDGKVVENSYEVRLFDTEEAADHFAATASFDEFCETTKENPDWEALYEKTAFCYKFSANTPRGTVLTEYSVAFLNDTNVFCERDFAGMSAFICKTKGGEAE